MNASTLRGLAVLTLLALAPCAGAVSVTQTATFSQSGTNQVGGFSGLTQKISFAPAGDGLASAVFDFTISSIGSVTMVNPFPIPLLVYPEISWDCFHSFVGGNFPSGDGVSFFSAGDPVIIPGGLGPFYSDTYTDEFSSAYSHTYSSLSALNYFTGSSVVADTRAMFYAPSSWGSHSLSGTVTVTLTYIYSAPDSGSSAPLLAGALVCLFVVVQVHQRRRKRSLL